MPVRGMGAGGMHGVPYRRRRLSGEAAHAGALCLPPVERFRQAGSRFQAHGRPNYLWLGPLARRVAEAGPGPGTSRRHWFALPYARTEGRAGAAGRRRLCPRGVCAPEPGRAAGA
jgi:hypothetical protein